MRPVPLLSVALTMTLLLASAFAQDNAYTNRLAPYVASPDRVVDTMLEMAELKPGETLYDLGSGDGRILIAAAARYQAKAVGVEITPRLVESAREEVERAGLADRIEVIEGDILTTDFSAADVVTLYLDTEANERLRPNLERYLKDGARVVSHDYEVPGWRPARVERTEGGGNGHMIYLYRVPVEAE